MASKVFEGVQSDTMHLMHNLRQACMRFIDLSQLGGFVCSAICEFHNRERSSRREESEADQELPLELKSELKGRDTDVVVWGMRSRQGCHGLRVVTVVRAVKGRQGSSGFSGLFASRLCIPTWNR